MHTGAPSTDATASGYGTPQTTPPRSGNPCDGSHSCVVDGAGGALAAANRYRTDHGLSPVPGGVSHDAQLCAKSSGASHCVPHYAWTALAKQDGAKAVSKIADFGKSWLLDSSIEKLSVGWAYVGGHYTCALLKAP